MLRDGDKVCLLSNIDPHVSLFCALYLRCYEELTIYEDVLSDYGLTAVVISLSLLDFCICIEPHKFAGVFQVGVYWRSTSNTNIINITTYVLGFLQGNDMFNNTGNSSFTDEGAHYTDHSQDAKG